MRAVRLVPLLVLGGAVAVLLLGWERIPERWVTHWGAGGRPDGWTTRTPAGVFFPIGLGVAMWGLMEAIAWGMRRWGEDSEGARRAPEAFAATVDFLRILAAGMASLFAVVAVALPLARPRTPIGVIAAALALLGVVTIAGMARIRRAVRAARARDPKGLAGWQGLSYRNPQDPRIWVPKLFGGGYTLNFAHRRAWAILAALLAVPLAIVILVAVLIGVAR